MTATASSSTLLPASRHFILRRLHSLTGIVFGGYLVVHLIINATIAQLSTVYQDQVDKIHHLPLLWAVEWLAIYIPILYHTVYGIWITATGQPNVANYPFGKNWFYLFQRISAIVIVLFMFFHIFAMKTGLFGDVFVFDTHRALHSVHSHMTAYWWVGWIVYPLGIVASCYHLANGFWTAAITWGLTVSASAQKRWGAVCAGLFLITLICGFVALASSVRLSPTL